MKKIMNISSINSSDKTNKRSYLAKSIFSLAMVGSMLLVGGCEKFLVKEPNFIAKENFYNNAKDVNAGLASVYDILGREALYGDRMSTFLAISDEGFWNRTNQLGPVFYNFDAGDKEIANPWQYLYEGIERANVFLSRIDAVSMDATERDNAKGQVKFLRAYYYFILASNWGAVPLKMLPTSSVGDVNFKATPLPELYNFIVTEMEAAEPMVKTATQVGFGGKISKSAVRGILAKVYLKMGGFPLNGGKPMFEKALLWAKKVVDPQGSPKEHRLNPSYQQIFTALAGDSYDIKEVIWEVEFFGNRIGDFEAGRIGNSTGIECLEDETNGKGYTFGGMNATKKLYDAYEPSDKRRDWNIAPFKYEYNTVAGRRYVRDSTYWNGTQIYNRQNAKFRRTYEKPARNKNYTPENYPLLRYADVLLMLVEAETEVNGATAYAAGYLNEVRARANASDVTATVLGNVDAMRTAVRKERFLELAFEGQRKWDLIRWGIFVSEMKQSAQDITANAGSFNYAAKSGNNITVKNNLFPIPVLELSLNKALTQNPGW